MPPGAGAAHPRRRRDQHCWGRLATPDLSARIRGRGDGADLSRLMILPILHRGMETGRNGRSVRLLQVSRVVAGQVSGRSTSQGKRLDRVQRGQERGLVPRSPGSGRQGCEDDSSSLHLRLRCLLTCTSWVPRLPSVTRNIGQTWSRPASSRGRRAPRRGVHVGGLPEASEPCRGCGPSRK